MKGRVFYSEFFEVSRKSVCSIFSWSVIGVGMIMIYKGTKISDPVELNQLGKKGLIWMGGLFVAQLTTGAIGGSKIRNAATIYNSKINTTTYRIGFQENGFGLALNF